MVGSLKTQERWPELHVKPRVREDSGSVPSWGHWGEEGGCFLQYSSPQALSAEDKVKWETSARLCLEITMITFREIA